ncbi:MAG: hypothetical protein J5602_07380, partial [Clostridia bacterium]|nr:hypothetical protein [Clostridia bacterium]
MRQAIRRSLSALVMLTLILIVAPTLAGHTASAATIVSNVTITGVEVPEIGETPDYYATATATGATLQNYNEGSWKRGVRWVNETDNKNMSATDTFKAGKVYAVYFCIEPKSGYTFKNSSGNVVTKATVNGKATGTPTMFDDGTLEVKYTFLSLKRKVGAVTITGVDTPVIGKTPDYVVSVSGTGTKRDNFNTTWWKNGVAWRDVTADASMKTTDTFKAGHSYMVRVSLYPADGYSFSNAAGDLIASGKIGGKEAETLLLGDENVIFEYTFPALVNPIPYVVISGVDAPVIGRTPDYDVNVTGTGVKRDTVTNDTCKNGVFWMDETTGWKVKTTETFQAGHTYKVCVSLYAETDYAFFDIAGNLTKGTINGKPAEAHEYSFDKTNYGYEYTFPALPERTIVSDAAIAVTAPKAGNAPVFKATMTATGAKVKGDYADNDFRNGVRWTNVTDNRHMKPTDVFEEGKVYKVDVYLVSDHESGYVFVDGLSLVRTKATVNEGTAAATRNSDTSITVSYEFPLLNRVIRTVTITDVDAPVAGLTPDYDITMSPEGFHRHEFSNDSLTEGVYWDDVTDNKRVKKTDTFIEGHEYKMTVTLISDDGYTFLDESGDIAATGTIDGIATETSKENGIDRVFIYFKCIFPKAKATALIESVAITDVDAPEAGATPDYDVTVNGKGVVRDNYTGSSWMNGVLWRDITADAPVNPTDTFVAGHQYKVFVSLISDASYTFYNEGGDVATTGTINGFAAETHKYSTGAGFSYAFPALPVPVAPAALIESVAITDVDAPAAGQTPDYDVTVSGEGCHKEDYNDDSTKGGVYWYDVTADSAVKTTDTFIGGHEYMLVVYMTSDDGYTFLNAGGDVATAGTINGNAAETHKGGAYVSFMYTFPKVAVPATLIESVTITGVDAPVAGATPDYDATVSGTGCIKSTHNTSDGWNNGMFWYDNTASKALIPTDTFVAGHEYRVIVWVMSKSGYTFLNESGDVATPGTINGNAAGTVKYGTTSVGFKYDFPALPEAAAPAALIESVTVTGVTPPAVGQTPSYDATVSGTGCIKST